MREKFNQFAETQTYKDILIGKSSSIVDTVKEINQVLNEDQEEYYRVLQDRELIAQELLLFERRYRRPGKPGGRSLFPIQDHPQVNLGRCQPVRRIARTIRA